MDQMRKEKEENLIKEQLSKDMIAKRKETGRKYEQELLEKLKKGKKQKVDRKEWGYNYSEDKLKQDEEKAKKLQEEKKSKDRMSENKVKKDNNFSNLPEEKLKKIKELINKNKAANKDKLGQTQNLDSLLSKVKGKKDAKPPKHSSPKKTNEFNLTKNENS
jgi:hypothetical protein